MSESNFKLKPSKIYLFLLAGVMIASLFILFFLPFESLSKGLGLIFLLLYGGHIIWQYGLLKSKKSIIQIQHQGDTKWLLYTKDKVYSAVLSGDSTVTSKMAILRFRIADHYLPKSCIIFRDSLVGERYRELVVQLRMSS